MTRKAADGTEGEADAEDGERAEDEGDRGEPEREGDVRGCGDDSCGGQAEDDAAGDAGGELG